MAKGETLFTANRGGKDNRYWNFKKSNLPEDLKSDRMIVLLGTSVAKVSKTALKYFYSDDKGGEIKGDGSPVTKADMEVHLELEKIFSAKRFKSRFVFYGEEGGKIPEQKNWDKNKTYIICDSINGTNNFINGDVFSIDLVVKKHTEEKGWHSTHSIIFSAKDGNCHIAAEGKGAYCSDPFGVDRKDLSKKKDAGAKISRDTIFIGMFGNEISSRFAFKIMENSKYDAQMSPRSFGSTALDMVGRSAGIMYGTPLNMHDIDAALLYFKEANIPVKVDQVSIKTPSKLLRKYGKNMILTSIVWAPTEQGREKLSNMAINTREKHNKGWSKNKNEDDFGMTLG